MRAIYKPVYLEFFPQTPSAHKRHLQQSQSTQHHRTHHRPISTHRRRRTRVHTTRHTRSRPRCRRRTPATPTPTSTTRRQRRSLDLQIRTIRRPIRRLISRRIGTPAPNPRRRHHLCHTRRNHDLLPLDRQHPANRHRIRRARRRRRVRGLEREGRERVAGGGRVDGGHHPGLAV